MSLWIDKHRPNTLNKLNIHPEITEKLLSLGSCDEIPHLMFYGPPGSGKKTRVMALLREIFGPGVEKVFRIYLIKHKLNFFTFHFLGILYLKVKLEHRSFKTTSNRTIEINTLGSNHHIECSPADVGNQDRLVIQEVCVCI